MDRMERERDIDQWLESALSQYGKTEPREGLESRVLANVRAGRNRIASARRCWWAAGTAAASAVVVAAVWVGESGREGNSRSVAGTSTTILGEEFRGSIQLGPTLQAAHPAGSTPAREVAKHRPTQPPVRDLAVATTPKLQQFPSPQALSEQEKLLSRYVEQFPQRAALIARAQTDLRERNQLEMAAPWPKNTDLNGLEREQ